MILIALGIRDSNLVIIETRILKQGPFSGSNSSAPATAPLETMPITGRTGERAAGGALTSAVPWICIYIHA